MTAVSPSELFSLRAVLIVLSVRYRANANITAFFQLATLGLPWDQKSPLWRKALFFVSTTFLIPFVPRMREFRCVEMREGTVETEKIGAHISSLDTQVLALAVTSAYKRLSLGRHNSSVFGGAMSLLIICQWP